MKTCILVWKIKSGHLYHMLNSEKILSALLFIFEKKVREKRKWDRIRRREKGEETYFFYSKDVKNKECCFM